MGRTSVAWVVAPLLLAGPLAAADSPPKLVGRWQLNEKESEDPHAKFRPLRPGEDPRRAGEGMPDGSAPSADGRGRRPRGQRPGADRPGQGAPNAKLEAPPGLAEFFEPARALTITGSEAELTFDDGKGTLQRLPIDGSPRKDASVTWSARWEGDSLVLEKKNEHGARLTTRYSLMAGQKKLEVYSRLAGTDARAVTLRRVYDAMEATP